MSRAISSPGSARRGSPWTWPSTTCGCPARWATRWATRCGRRATAGCRCGSPSTRTSRSPSRARSSRRRRARSRRCWSSSACRCGRSRAGATSCTTSTSCATARRCGPARRTGRSTPGSARRTCSWRSSRPTLAAAYARNFAQLWERGHVGNSGNFDAPRQRRRAAVVLPRARPGALAPDRQADRGGAAAGADRLAGADRRADPRHAVRGDRRGPGRHRGRVRRDPDPPGLPAVGGQPGLAAGRRRCCAGR